MSSRPESDPADFPLVDSEAEGTYTLEVVARLTGISSQTVVRYCERGFVSRCPAGDSPGDAYVFDVEALRRLRRIEDLRRKCEVNEQGLHILVGLLDEVEQLRADLRRARAAGM